MKVAIWTITLGIIFVNSAAASRWCGPRGCPVPEEEDYRHDPVSPEDYRPYHEGNSCTCLLLVGDSVVYRSEDRYGWYSCSGWGLHRCDQYCIDMFQDEDIRYRSRQEACDVFGREIYTSWYRRSQVCGYHGAFVDNPIQVNLCCRRGRPSRECRGEPEY